MLAFKFSGDRASRIKIRYLIALVGISAIAGWILGWLGVSVGFVTYLALSLLYKKNTHDLSGTN